MKIIAFIEDHNLSSLIIILILMIVSGFLFGQQTMNRLEGLTWVAKENCGMEGQEVYYQPVFFKTVPEQVGSTQNSIFPLNGTWKFNPDPPNQFWSDPSDYPDWPDISVPGEWVMQGFTVNPNTAAAYFRIFDLPSDWQNKCIILRCDAVYSDAEVFINSRKVGQHQGGFTPFEFDVTKYIQVGKKNRIALAVKNESLEDTLGSVTRYAAHQLGGITRKIYLFVLPKLYLENLQIETHFDIQYKDATLKLRTFMVNESKHEQNNVILQIELFDPQGKPVSINSNFQVPSVAAGQRENFIAEIAVTEPQKWESEHPNLYTLIVHLKNNKRTLESIRQKIGFRQIEIRGNQLYVNGKSVKLRGINRHEVHPVLGRSLNMELWKKDAELFRNANMNYIRTSHYPPAREFIAMCDSLGLFVELEAPFVWMGHAANATWQERSAHDLKLFPSVMRGISEMINYYFNHPSILIWSMANESAWSRNWERAYQLANLLDTTRPKSFHDQAYGEYNSFGSTIMPIANMHYPGPDGPEHVKDFGRPLLFGEYCHLNTYNRQEIVTDPGVRDYYGVAISPMWQNMYASQGCLGGAIWSGIDDVFELPDGRAVGYGEWGPIDGWRREKPEYWHIKKAYSPIRIANQQIKIPASGQPIQIEVANWHDFTNLNELGIEWNIADERGVVKTNIAPKEKGMILIQTKKRIYPGQKLKLWFRSPRGFMIDSFELPIASFDKESLNLIQDREGIEPFKLITETNRIVVHNREQEWIIDRQSGKFISGSQNGETVLLGGPHLMMLLLISGPCSTEHSREISPFNDICTRWRAVDVEASNTNKGIIIKVNGEYDQASGQYTYFFNHDGTVRVDYDYVCKMELEPRQIGLVFDLDESLQTLQWDRKAYWTNYPEDHIGRPQGKAQAFPMGKNKAVNHRQKPGHAWAYDYHPMGCNDFRATRRNIYHAELCSLKGHGLKVLSDGSQHTRAFIDGGKSHLLIACYDTGGADIFLASHYENERLKIEPGSRVKGSVIVQLTEKN